MATNVFARAAARPSDGNKGDAEADTEADDDDGDDDDDDEFVAGETPSLPVWDGYSASVYTPCYLKSARTTFLCSWRPSADLKTQLSPQPME